MSNKMIIDASHPEETRVVVLKGNRVEEFDFESANKKPLRGNIYLAKVTRVEPSLQAAFIDYGGNRHGFLAFSEIHPDYYQIPVADRQALLEDEARSHREDEEEPNGERRSRRHRRSRGGEAEMRAANDDRVVEAAPVDSEGVVADEDAAAEGAAAGDEPAFDVAASDSDAFAIQAEASESPAPAPESAEPPAAAEPASETPGIEAEAAPAPGGEEDDEEEEEVTTLGGGGEEPAARAPRRNNDDVGEAVEQIGGDEIDEAPRRAPRLRRQYKIQEVIKRRQVLLVQVVKEERGNKGAALTTYLSLAGRYSVLMPNTARGGGISRKITNAQDRGRLKAIADELEVPEGMGVILRTAGASRTKPEVKRDFEYLLRMWETVRETTLTSSAPTLVYEEGSLIKRAIRDLYSKEVEEIVVAGESGFREARDFMRLLMPTHVKSVVPYRDSQPVFAKSGVEAQLDAMFSNQVTLKSGGYIVINQTEALVAIDVNSGRSTREHNIEDTALRTNLEAADEIARQLRLRDLAGLIVVDFIDMEEGRNNRAVERRMKDALKNDRARIQVGRISHFGLLEMSRQRIRTGVLEGSTIICPHCLGAGVVRSTASVALHVLRVLEDALIKSATHDMTVRARTPVALYILNQKRPHLRDLERRFSVSILVEADDTLTGANHHALDRGELSSGARADEPAEARHAGYGAPPVGGEDFVVEEEVEAVEDANATEGEAAADEFEAEAERGEAEPAAAGEGEPSRPRRRRRRRRGGGERGERSERGERPSGEGLSAEAPQPTDDGLAAMAEIGGDFAVPTRGEGETADDEERGPSSRRRRGRRGRRGGGDRERFGAPAPTGDVTPVEGEPEPNLFDDPPHVTESEATAPAATAEAAPPAAAAEAASPPARADVPAPAIERAPARASEPAPDSDEPAPEATPAAEDPSRPRRSGWWQRARATLSGE